MHIPAMDALRQERVGIVTDDSGAIGVVKAYVKTDDTEEQGAYDPIEGMARPFPLMLHSGGSVVCVESFIENETNSLEAFSDHLIGYTQLLYDSMQAEEWVEELETFDDEQFSSVEREIASSLQQFAAMDIPRELFRIVYEASNRLSTERDAKILDNPLCDVEDRERYNFAFLPEMEDVTDWELVRFEAEVEVEEEDENAISESLWLRYSVDGESYEERPLLSYSNNVSGLSALSSSVDFGNDESVSIPSELVPAILSEDETTESVLADIDPAELGQRTRSYLEAYCED